MCFMLPASERFTYIRIGRTRGSRWWYGWRQQRLPVGGRDVVLNPWLAGRRLVLLLALGIQVDIFLAPVLLGDCLLATGAAPLKHLRGHKDAALWAFWPRMPMVAVAALSLRPRPRLALPFLPLPLALALACLPPLLLLLPPLLLRLLFGFLVGYLDGNHLGWRAERSELHDANMDLLLLFFLLPLITYLLTYLFACLLAYSLTRLLANILTRSPPALRRQTTCRRGSGFQRAAGDARPLRSCCYCCCCSAQLGLLLLHELELLL